MKIVKPTRKSDCKGNRLLGYHNKVRVPCASVPAARRPERARHPLTPSLARQELTPSEMNLMQLKCRAVGNK